jgi:predicted Rossmann-fold nucleotide-binding protein
MPLRRVVLLETGSPKPESRDAERILRALLQQKGISLVAEAGDGIVALPGSLRSFEELFQRHLAGNDLPCGLLDTSGYYSDLLKTAEDGLVDRVVRESQRGRLIVQRDPALLIQAMAEYLPPETRRQTGAPA